MSTVTRALAGAWKQLNCSVNFRQTLPAHASNIFVTLLRSDAHTVKFALG